jgi:hypothetical protein
VKLSSHIPLDGALGGLGGVIASSHDWYGIKEVAKSEKRFGTW